VGVVVSDGTGAVLEPLLAGAEVGLELLFAGVEVMFAAWQAANTKAKSMIRRFLFFISIVYWNQ
jgi:hypothetical protein